ncbi:MAG: response regulator [Chitinispirillaceae bacterium]|nr:response regulator [Chitinispirillaceae bacterium]
MNDDKQTLLSGIITKEVITSGFTDVLEEPGITLNDAHQILLIAGEKVILTGFPKVLQEPDVTLNTGEQILLADDKEVVAPVFPKVLQEPDVTLNTGEQILLADDKEVVAPVFPKVLKEKPGVTLNAGKRILLVDDEEVISFGFSKVLEEPGVVVDCAQTLGEAQNCIAAHHYDAAIVDLRLSNSTEMEGFDCIRLLRSRQSECKIIVMTAYGGNGFKDQAIALGADLFLEKPMEPEKIREYLMAFGIYDD